MAALRKTRGMGTGMGSASGPCPDCDGIGRVSDGSDVWDEQHRRLQTNAAGEGRRHELGAEALTYLRRYLDRNARHGKRLGRLLAQRDVNAGTAWAFLPHEPSPSMFVDFENGGHNTVDPQLDPSEWSTLVDPMFDPIMEWLASVLRDQTGSTRMFCVEDRDFLRSEITEDPPPAAPPGAQRGPLFFCAEDVYEYALADDVEDEDFMPPLGALWQPDVGIVTELPFLSQPVPRGHSVSPEAIERMAANMVAIIVGAWDQEGFIVWEPA